MFFIPTRRRFHKGLNLSPARAVNLMFGNIIQVIKDQRPYYLKKLHKKFQDFYTEHFIRPHLAYLGKNYIIIRPWNIEIFGAPIKVGEYAHIIPSSDKKTKLVVWAENADQGGITIGDYCLISPGVRISAVCRITIGDNCMLANEVYITDADWHGIYDRVYSVGDPAPVTLEENVWIGDSSIICKGATIGRNSVVGAGSVVTGDIPPNTVAAGNPAKVIKQLDTSKIFTKREKMFENPALFFRRLDDMDKSYLKGNTLLGWLRSLLFPRPRD